MKSKAVVKITAALFLFAVWRNFVWIAAAQQYRLTLNGDGSTFAYLMYSKWIEEYQKDNHVVHLTYESNGSGAGHATALCFLRVRSQSVNFA